MDSYRIAKRRPAKAQLIARTDGRTNERPTHLLETSSVTYRAREIEVFHRSDLEFTEFLLTRNTAKVRHEQFVEQVTVTIHRMYDQETERLAVLMHQDRKQAA